MANWTKGDIQKVCEKGVKDSNNDPTKWRKDACGAWIARDKYGNRDSQHGWEIDHIDPDGSDDIDNLQPLQWENNVDKSDGRLKCNVTADGIKNVKK